MKKFLATFKTFVGTVMTVSMLAMGAVATSCSDDCDHDQEIDAIGKRLDQLDERVTALENSLANEVASLKALIEAANGKTTIVSCEEQADGSVVVTLSDGSSFTVNPAAEVGDEVYIAPYQYEDGTYYWAYIVNGEPAAFVTDYDGNRVPVFQQSEDNGVEITGLKLRVNADTLEVEYSLDGQNWLSTGLKVSDLAGGEEETTSCACVIKSIEEVDGKVVFTLMDGSTIEITKTEEITFSVKQTLYVAPEASKEVALEFSENVEDCSLMNKPEGWRVSIDGKVMTVTAPAKALVESGAADRNGVVTLHINTTSGKCKVAKLNVAYAELTLTVDSKTGDITVTNSTVITTKVMDPITWEMVDKEVFGSWYIGAIPTEQYSLEYLEEITMGWSGYVSADYFVRPEYVVNECELETISTTFAELYSQVYYGQEYTNDGASYVVWILPFDPTTNTFIYKEVITTNYKPSFINVEENVEDKWYNDIQVKATMRGNDAYYVGLSVRAEMEDPNMTYDQYEFLLQEWQMYAQYGATFGDAVYENECVYEGSLSGIIVTNELSQAEILKPNTEYVLFVLPVDNDKDASEYTKDDILKWYFTTSDIAEGGSATATVTCTPGYDTLAANIEVSETAEMVYYNWYEQGAEAVEFGGADLKNDLISNGVGTIDFPIAANKNYLSVGTTMTLAVLVIDEEGKYTLSTQEYTTLTIDYNDTYTVTLGTPTVESKKLTIPVSVSGGTVVKYRFHNYRSSYAAYGDSYNPEKLEGVIPTKADDWYAYGTYVVESESLMGATSNYEFDGTNLVVKNLSNNTEYTVLCMVQFEDGSWSRIATVTGTPALNLGAVYGPGTDEFAAAAKPTVTYRLAYDPEYEYGIDVYFTVTNTEGVAASYAGFFSEEYFPNALNMGRVSYLVENNPVTSGVEKASYINFKYDYSTGGYTTTPNANTIWYCWSDAEGNYYGVDSIVISQEEFDAAIAAANSGEGGDEEDTTVEPR